MNEHQASTCGRRGGGGGEGSGAAAAVPRVRRALPAHTHLPPVLFLTVSSTWVALKSSCWEPLMACRLRRAASGLMAFQMAPGDVMECFGNTQLGLRRRGGGASMVLQHGDDKRRAEAALA